MFKKTNPYLHGWEKLKNGKVKLTFNDCSSYIIDKDSFEKHFTVIVNERKADVMAALSLTK